MIFLLILFLIFAPSSTPTKAPANLVKVDLTGMIISSEEVVKKIEEANKDANIKGILFDVNSPGGMVPPSIEIAQAIKRVKKPVIAYSSGTMASGSYYASIYADKIYANPGSIVGSIGVIFEGMNAAELLDTIGIDPQTIKIGKYKEVGTPKREWNEAERQELQTIAKDIYDMFISDVAKARELDVNNHHQYADAHIFTALRAKQKGLIDEVGTMYDAKKALESLSGVQEPRWKEKDKIDRFLERLEASVHQFLSSYFNGFKASF